MKRSIDDGGDDKDPEESDFAPVWWRVKIEDGVLADGGYAVVLELEERGNPGLGQVAHLAPATARRLRLALKDALKELGEDPGA